MSTYHAVMIDETGCEFGVSVPEQPTREAAYDWLRENYPESRCDQLETPIESAMREQSYYDDAQREYDGDDYYYDDEDDEEDVDDDSYDEYPEDQHLDGMWEE